MEEIKDSKLKNKKARREVKSFFNHEKFYVKCEESHRCFAGVIYESDFHIGIDSSCSFSSLYDIAQRIARDERFNFMCSGGRVTNGKFY